VELVLKARGLRITDPIRRSTEHKLSKIARLAPDARRLEVEFIEEPNARINGGHRVEVACDTPRRTYRAAGTGPDIEVALDQVVEHLETQLTRHRGKLHDRWTGRSNRLQSPRTSPEAAGNSD
jgi:ribosomal subunit interface protein